MSNTNAETLAWLDALYGNCSKDDGHIVIVKPSKRELLSVEYVGTPDMLVQAANAMAETVGHYIKINLMDGQAMLERSRRDGKGRYIVGNINEVKTIVSIHLDVDAGKSGKYPSREEAIEALDNMPHKPTLIVNSDGHEGGFHAYWILDKPHRIVDDADRQRISDAARRWQNRLNELAPGDLDATANIDRILRIVGRPRIDGGMVSCFRYEPDRVYTIEQLTIPRTIKEIKETAAESMRLKLERVLGPVKTTGRPVSDYIDTAKITVEDLLQDGGYEHMKGDEWIRCGSESGARTLKIATKNSRPGINVFSGNETRFPCTQKNGNIGCFYSIDQVFVTLRHGGDWKAAASWCRQQLGDKANSKMEIVA